MKCTNCGHETMHSTEKYTYDINGNSLHLFNCCREFQCLCTKFGTITEEQFQANKLYHEGKPS